MTALTKFDVAAIRKADAIVVHLSSSLNKVRLIKRRDTSKPFSEDQEHVLPAEVTVYGYHGQNALTNGAQFCAHQSIYHRQICKAATILRQLRVGDEPVFEFYPDANSNGYLAAAGLHADVCNLKIRRNGKIVAVFELTDSVCPDNSARMCRGVPATESYRAAAKERLAVA